MSAEQARHPELEKLLADLNKTLLNAPSPLTVAWLNKHGSIMDQIRTYMIENGVNEYHPSSTAGQ